jgi:dTMP kinase
MLITFEGPEGSGKSVNAAWTRSLLAAQGIRAVLTREPGGTMLGERLRSLIFDDEQPPNPVAALWLFEAARAQLVDAVIRPALSEGRVVLCDRFTDSTLAYQGYGEGLSLAKIRALNILATGGLVPDLSVLLDLDPEVGLQRRGDAGQVNSMDRRDIDFHRRVRDGFLTVAREEPARWLVLDACLPLKLLRERIATCLIQRGVSVRDATSG